MKKKVSNLLALLLLLAAAMAAASAARAQTVYNLYQGNSFTYNGLTFTISSCSFSNNSRSSTCNATDYGRYLPSGTQFYIATDPSAPSTSVIIEALNGGSQVPMFTYTCSTSGGCTNNSLTYDLGLTLTVAPASGTLSSASATLSASALTSGHTTDTSIVTNDPNDVTAQETMGSLCNGSGGLNTNLQTSTQSCTFTPQTSLSVTKDLGLAISGVTNGSTIALNSLVENFAHAPEPSSLAMLVPGLLMLGWSCRRKILR